MDVDMLDALLPQMQCRQCGFAGCRPYAQALVEGTAPFDGCVPGGASLVKILKQALRTSSLPSLPSLPLPSRAYSTLPSPSPSSPVLSEQPVPHVAWIDEGQCIGCALCVAVCPVDAIVGAPQWMHTVIESDCTGCALCVAPCPVECIQLREHSSPDPLSGYAVSPDKARRAYMRQRARRSKDQHQKTERLLALYHPVEAVIVQAVPSVPTAERSALIEQLRARAKARREGHD